MVRQKSCLSCAIAARGAEIVLIFFDKFADMSIWYGRVCAVLFSLVLIGLKCQALMHSRLALHRRGASTVSDRRNFSLFSSLKKVIVKLPAGTPCREYEPLIFQQIPPENVVRWYASKFSPDLGAELEVIVEDKGVGNSSSQDVLKEGQ